jgi:uncharacterized protein YeaO (DUF488 family)
VSIATIERNVRLKRIYDAASPDDGYRVLTTRYWPRGVAKGAKDEYSTKTAPSRQLLHEFKHEGLTWDDYVVRYLDEMKSEAAQSEIHHLAELAKSRTITLMCVCEDENHCHRSLLRDLIVVTGNKDST